MASIRMNMPLTGMLSFIDALIKLGSFIYCLAKLGFFVFSQCRVRPLTEGEPSRLLTISCAHAAGFPKTCSAFGDCFA
jgi:hypothetical protein